MKSTTIIPVASGKGGTGKSLVSSNLAIALSRMGNSTVIIDLDFGGSNLHSYLGLPNKYPGVGDFLKGRRSTFSSLLMPTKFSNLRFMPGDGRTPFMANIPDVQRVQLIREIKKVQAKYIILDLGAGSAFNTMNFFGLTHKGLIVTTFENPAIMNFLMFMKNFIFRIISSRVRSNKQVFKMVLDAFRQPMTSHPVTVNSLIKQIARLDQGLAAGVKRTCSLYQPRVIFNQGESSDELKVLGGIDRSLKQNLAIEAGFFGYIKSDEVARRAVKRKEILLDTYPSCDVAKCIERIANKISISWEQPMQDSARTLLEDVRRYY
jgi:flagellar biosynthesis protein FlhG